MSFARLRLADWVALLASLALLFTMATDWYTSKVGEDARDTQGTLQQLPPDADERDQALDDARTQAEGEEENAWQATGALDRIILVALLGTVALAVLTAFLRAADVRFDPPYTPSSLTALAASVSALLVLYRIIQEPGVDETTVVKAGAPLSLLVLGVIALSGVIALRDEEDAVFDSEFEEFQEADEAARPA